MKLTTFLIFINLLQVSAIGYSQKEKLSLKLKSASLKEMFVAIERQTNYTFLYRDDVLDKQLVTINASGVPLAEILDNTFKNTGSTYRFLDNNLIVVAPKESASLEKTVNISGRVTDARTGEPLTGAAIFVTGTQKGVVSGADGSYQLDRVPETASLTVRFIGYKEQKIEVNGRSVINIALESDVRGLNEVVVTALGLSKEKKKLGFGVTEIKGESLAGTYEINPINALAGKVAGVSIDQTASGAFGSARILIRGNSTLGANNQPIFVVDGVIVDNTIITGGRDYGNDLKNLNTEDFETVTVLKGSSAAALYGSRAINGVILITTKKGKKSDGIGVTLSHSSTIYTPYAGSYLPK